MVCEAYRETLAGEFGPVDPSLEGVLDKCLHLHLLANLERDLATFLAAGLLSPAQVPPPPPPLLHILLFSTSSSPRPGRPST